MSLHTTRRILGFLVLALTLPLAAQNESDSAQPPTQPATLAPQVPSNGLKPIQAPATPERVKATFNMGGKDIQVTEKQFYDTYLLLKPHEERKDQSIQPQRIIEQILMFAEADALGLTPTAEELAEISPLRPGALFADSMRERFKSMGITETDYHEYLRQSRAIERLKAVTTNDIRVRSPQAYELWKGENHLFRISCVEFPASAIEKELLAKGASEEELRKFWAENGNAQNKYRRPTTVTADLLLFDPAQLNPEQVAALASGRKVTREESLAHFKKHKDRLMQQIPSEERPKLYPAPGQLPTLEKIVTPFELLVPVIERELILGDPLGAAFEEAKSAGAAADMKTLAAKNGLKHARIEKADNAALALQFPAGGHQLFADLFNAPPGQLAASIAWQEGKQYFWRSVDRAVSSLPSFEEVRTELVKDWAHETAVVDAQKRCTAFEEALRQSVAAELAPEEARLDLDAVEAATREVAALPPEQKQQADMVRQKHTIFSENKKRSLRAGLMARNFESAAGKAGLKVSEIQPFAFEMIHIDRSSLTDPEELRQTFLKSSFQIRGMEAGQISPILSDVVLGSHFLVKLIAREEPSFESMPATEFGQRMSGLERQEVYSALYRWSAQQLMQRHGWTEN